MDYVLVGYMYRHLRFHFWETLTFLWLNRKFVLLIISFEWRIKRFLNCLADTVLCNGLYLRTEISSSCKYLCLSYGHVLKETRGQMVMWERTSHYMSRVCEWVTLGNVLRLAKWYLESWKEWICFNNVWMLLPGPPLGVLLGMGDEVYESRFIAHQSRPINLDRGIQVLKFPSMIGRI